MQSQALCQESLPLSPCHLVNSVHAITTKMQAWKSGPRQPRCLMMSSMMGFLRVVWFPIPTQVVPKSLKLGLGWGSITKIKGYDIFHKYGLVTVKESRKYAKVRFKFDVAGDRIITRDAQASWQMMTCLMNSCSPECLNKVYNSSEDHIITNANGEFSEDGPLLLCILVSRVLVDKRSTMSYYSHQLTWLDQLMTKVNCNCTAFNDEVKDIVYQFESRGWWIFSKVTKQFQTKCLWPTSGWKNMNTKKVDPSMQKNWWHTQKISTWKW